MNGVSQFYLMEIDEQPKGDIQQFHVAQELRLVDRQHFLDSLGFHKYAAFHEHIETQWLLSRETFVFNQDGFLSDTFQAAQAQLRKQTPLLDRFDQARPFVSMNLNRRADDGLGQL